jgi:uncharacterized membrane protein (DUF4010 family)
MDHDLAFQRLALALGLGLLVGLQRERQHIPTAGIRTFALITVLGNVCGLLSVQFGGWIVGLVGLGLAVLLLGAHLIQSEEKDTDPGLTTEIAALLMFGVGAYLVQGYAPVGIAIGSGTAILLQLKRPLHEFVNRIGEDDVKAIMQFALVALVILPVLPDQTYGPYQVLNPQNIWLMVVLIVAISLGGYVAFKLLGRRGGALVGGLLGGLISSTATTVSYSRNTRQNPDIVPLAALVVTLASTVAYARVLTEIAIVAPNTFVALAPPLAVMLGIMVLLSMVAFFLGRRASAEQEQLQPQNPTELKAALIFGGLYALVILGIAAAKDWFGDQGMYAIAILSGLHDMDAITLSTSRLVGSGEVSTDVGWRLILVASLANLVVKAALTALLGNRQLFVRVGAMFGVALLCGLAMILLWPAG